MGLNRKIFLLITFSLLFLSLTTITLGISDEALSLSVMLNNSYVDMQEMVNLGFNVVRYNDTLFLTEKTLEAKIIAEENGEIVDYSLINSKISELVALKKIALKTSDELNALKNTIDKTEGIDIKPVNELYTLAIQEFKSERYEKSKEYIDLTYEKISELEAVQTKVKAFYNATSRSFVGFLKSNWVIILMILTTLFLIFIFGYKRFVIYNLKNKILNLERRRKSLNNLIKKTQTNYFQEKNLSEINYHIRIKKYGELTRDINRQIPLLKEALALQTKYFFVKNNKNNRNNQKNKSDAIIKKEQKDKFKPVILKKQNRKLIVKNNGVKLNQKTNNETNKGTNQIINNITNKVISKTNRVKSNKLKGLKAKKKIKVRSLSKSNKTKKSVKTKNNKNKKPLKINKNNSKKSISKKIKNKK